MDYMRSVYFLYPIIMATFILAAIYSIPCAHRYQIGSGALVPPPLQKKSPILHNYIPDVSGDYSPIAHKQEVSSVTETVMHAESSVVPVSDLIGDTVLLPESDATLNYNIGNAQPRQSSEGNATDTVTHYRVSSFLQKNNTENFGKNLVRKSLVSQERFQWHKSNNKKTVKFTDRRKF